MWGAVRRDPSAPWDLERLSALVDCSVSQLVRQCKQHYNSTPFQLLTRIRLQLAEQALLQTSHTVDTIAQHVGYKHGFALSKVFKRKHDISPGEYRKRCQLK